MVNNYSADMDRIINGQLKDTHAEDVMRVESFKHIQVFNQLIRFRIE